MTISAPTANDRGYSTGCLHNMSVPPRTTASAEVRPVFGAVIVCLAQCLRLHGFFDRKLDISETDFEGLGKAVFSWVGSSSLDDLWRKIAAKGYSRRSADACAREFGGARIGWTGQIYPQGDALPHYPPHNRICTNLNLCLAVLSRRVDNLFLSYRLPDYSRDQLLCWAFVADDPGFAERSISWKQWPLRKQEKPRPEENPLNPISWQPVVRHGPGARTL
jgi:hypothetical protein